MTALHTCLACTITSHDVAMTLIDLEAEGTKPGEQRVIEVPFVSAQDHGQIRGFDYVAARERYVNEPRCRDKAACAARVKALEADRPKPADTEEGPTWMRT